VKAEYLPVVKVNQSLNRFGQALRFPDFKILGT